jgi:hypothetical protein
MKSKEVRIKDHAAPAAGRPAACAPRSGRCCVCLQEAPAPNPQPPTPEPAKPKPNHGGGRQQQRGGELAKTRRLI